DGRLKVLDFGLAKLREDAGAGPTTGAALGAGSGPGGGSGSGSQMPTRAVQTEDGRILGTVAYMSPEQAEGKPVDARSDVFSLGILLYEMATGERPFKGDSKMSILSSILRDTPVSVTDLNRNLPRHLGRIVKRCLAKDLERRYGNARELYNDLLELKEEVDSGEVLPVDATGAGAAAGGAPLFRSRAFIGSLGVVAAAAVAVALVLFIRGRPDTTAPAASPPVEASFTQLTTMPGDELHPSLSPDGRMLVFTSRSSGNRDIYFRIVGGQKTLNLTEDSDADDEWPAFSPDGMRIAFVSARDGGGLFVMGATGESVRRLANQAYNPSWSPDGQEIIFSTQSFLSPYGRTGHGEIRAVNVDTGAVREISHQEDAVQPVMSPGGKRIAFWGLPAGTGQRDIWTIPAKGGEAVPVTSDRHTDWNPIWSPDGRFLYFCSDRSGSMNIWRVPIEEETGRTLGPPQAVTTGVTSVGHVTITADGRRLAYVSGDNFNNLQKLDFDSVSGTVHGEPEWITRGSNRVFFFDPSPDGTWIAFNETGQTENVFVIRADGSGRRQLNSDPAKDRGFAISPDGLRIAFYSDRSGTYEAWSIRPDGSDLKQLTDTPQQTVSFPTWSPDGSRMAIVVGGEDGGAVIQIFDPNKPWAEQEPEILPAFGDPGVGFQAYSWSADGNWLAGDMRPTEGVSSGIVVYSFKTSEYRKVSDFGGWPHWLADSRRLLFTHDQKVYLADRTTGEIREIYSTHPDGVFDARPSRDNHTLYLVRMNFNRDIWMMTLE
ncbi:MAG: protein kinase, partial [Acidobacteria bacterium]|nr:protein kinase [Acidobacteriota bacterium]